MLVGLTGGIACGKSTVARMFTERGAILVDADAIARDVVRAGTEGFDAVVEAFGPDVLAPEGGLDRAALGSTVFGDDAARRRLEAILHPLIASESGRRLQAAFAEGAPLVVYDAALLFESGRSEHFRPVVVVSAPPDVQLRRLMARDGLDEPSARARIDAQMPVAEKVARADHVIDNGGTREQTEAAVAALWDTLVGETA
jgi:dephospho-CoA kinase